MNFKYLKNYLIVVFVFISSINFGQFSISGKIVDQDGEPLIGATVFINKISIGTTSDIYGVYQIQNIEKGSYQITYSAVGYKKLEDSVSVNSNVVKDVNLIEDILLLNEAVVIGYGTARTKDLTGSAAIIKSEDFNKGKHT